MYDKLTELNEKRDALKAEIEVLLNALAQKEKEVNEIGVKLDKLKHIKRCKFCDRLIYDKFKLATAIQVDKLTKTANVTSHVVCLDCFKSISFK